MADSDNPRDRLLRLPDTRHRVLLLPVARDLPGRASEIGGYDGRTGIGEILGLDAVA